MAKKFEEHNCEMKNESACEEELGDDNINFEEEEAEEFGEW